MEIIDATCSKEGAIIFCSQREPNEWYYLIDCDRDAAEDSAVAEGILDRIIHNKYLIDVKGRVSMRKRHGLDAIEEGVIET